MATDIPISLIPLAPTSGPHWGGMPESLLEDIYRSDQLMYPAPSLTYDRFRRWAAACPHLFTCLRRGQEQRGSGPLRLTSDTVHGVVVALPLVKEHWERLLTGNIGEHDIEPTEMFPPSSSSEGLTETEVGLHIFHIERCPEYPNIWKNGGKFTEQALEQVSSTVAERYSSWKVIGYSALTATPQGKAAFQRAGFRRIGYHRLSPWHQGILMLRRLAFRCLVLSRLALRRVGLERLDMDPESGAPAEMVERRGNDSFLLPIKIEF